MMKIYCVVDRKAKDLVSVFASNSDEAAKRSFLMLLTGPKNIFTDFPEDFELYSVCDLSFDSGLKVSRPGCENLEANGFKCDSFVIYDAVESGSDYDKRWLAMIHYDRYQVFVEPEFEPKNLHADLGSVEKEA